MLRPPLQTPKRKNNTHKVSICRETSLLEGLSLPTPVSRSFCVGHRAGVPFSPQNQHKPRSRDVLSLLVGCQGAEQSVTTAPAAGCHHTRVMRPVSLACIALCAIVLLDSCAVSTAADAAPFSTPVELLGAFVTPAPTLHRHSIIQLPQSLASAPARQPQLLATDRPLVVAHRGASGLLPEHTAAAYTRAIEQGADMIECDVVVTKDLQLLCRHEPNLVNTTDALEKFGDRMATYTIDGQQVKGVFAADLALAEVKQLKARQRWGFRDHSYDGQFGLVTLAEFIDIAQAADRPVGIYPESKHPTWHNNLPALQKAGTTIEQLMVDVLHAKGYAASAPYASTAWRSRPIFIQSFEVSSLRRFAALTRVPLALLLDQAPAPDSGLSLKELVSEQSLSELSKFVTVMAPWKALLYSLEDKQPQQQQQQQQQGPEKTAATAAAAAGAASKGLVLPGTAAAAASTSSQNVHASDGSSSGSSGFLHPDVPLSAAATRSLQQTQVLRSTGLAERLHKRGFLVHTFTLRDEGQFVLPTCQQAITCEFEWLFDSEHLDGAFADFPGTLTRWLQQRAG